jgi:hypothetical protein
MAHSILSDMTKQVPTSQISLQIVSLSILRLTEILSACPYHSHLGLMVRGSSTGHDAVGKVGLTSKPGQFMLQMHNTSRPRTFNSAGRNAEEVLGSRWYGESEYGGRETR